MSVFIKLHKVNVLSGWPNLSVKHHSCQAAEGGCRPAFVFSLPGQANFKASLNHLKYCRHSNCVHLKSKVWRGITNKLTWLMNQKRLLGCVKIQPLLYGATKLAIKKNDFPLLAHHLANCPFESCAQLRRALLLTIRRTMAADEH